MIRNVVWDWNGTLLDDLSHCLEVMNELLDADGLERLTVERYHRVFGFPVRDYYARIGFDLTDERWPRLAASFIERYDAGVRGCDLHPGARSALERLRQRDCRSSILTAARQTSVEALLDHLQVRHLVGDVVGLDDDYAASKQAVGLAWMTSSHLDPDETVLVGDTLHDFEVAEALGVRCILLTVGHHPAERLRECQCPIATSHDDVVEMIERMRS